MYGNLQTFPRSTAKPMTDKRKSIFLLHLSLESVCVMTDSGAALLELYAAFGEPWWVGPLAMTAESCRGIGLWKVTQKTREAASPVARTGGGVGGAAPDTGGHLLEAHYARTVPTVWAQMKGSRKQLLESAFLLYCPVIELDFQIHLRRFQRFFNEILKRF